MLDMVGIGNRFKDDDFKRKFLYYLTLNSIYFASHNFMGLRSFTVYRIAKSILIIIIRATKRGAGGQIAPRASWSRVLHKVRPKFLFAVDNVRLSIGMVKNIALDMLNSIYEKR